MKPPRLAVMLKLHTRMKVITCLSTILLALTLVRAGAQTPPAAVGEKAPPPAPAGNEVIPLISLDAEFKLIDALKSFAEQAHLSIEFAPELMPDGKPNEILQQPVGARRFDHVTYRQALEKLLAKENLMLGKNPTTGAPTVASKDANLVPYDPAATEAAHADEEDVEILSDSSKEVPLLTAINLLAKLSRLNILIDPKVKTGGTRVVGTNIVELPPIGTNTVSLSSYGGVSPQQTLEAVLGNFGLALVSDPRTQFSQVTYKDPGAREPMFTYVIQLHYSNTTNMMQLLATAFPLSRIQPDGRTAQLVVTATQKDHGSMTNLLASLDLPTKQVLIEARFLETLQNPKSVKGIDWTDTLQAQKFSFGNGTVGGSSIKDSVTRTPGTPITTTLPSGRTVTTTPASSVNTTTTSSEATTIGAGGITASTTSGFNPSTAFLNAQGVNAALSFLNTELDSKTLSTPRVVTQDNQETRLEVTRSIPIFDSSEGLGQSGATVSSTKPNYTNIGTILIVTPRISGSNVAMRVRPEISKVEGLPSRKVINNKVNEADIFATSKVDTQVIVPSGNTLVMGGLVSDSTSRNYVKVPILGDIPLLGWAFRKEGKERSRANLIIFLTPTIIETENFQPSKAEFLATKVPEYSTETDKAWDSGRSNQDIRKERKSKAAEEEQKAADARDAEAAEFAKKYGKTSAAGGVNNP